MPVQHPEFLRPHSLRVRQVTTGLLQELYLAPRTADWPLAEAMAQQPATWSESLKVAPDKTVLAVEAALRKVIRATGNLDPSSLDPEGLPAGRAKKHLTALHDLWHDMGGALPEDLAVWRHVLRAKAEDALEPLLMMNGDDSPYADAADEALARALIGHHGMASGEARNAWHARHPARAASAPGALGHVQAHLKGAAGEVAQDGTLSVFGLRDPNDEAEFAAARVQRMLDDGTIDTPSQAGILVPDDPAYRLALARAFDCCGLHRPTSRRNPPGSIRRAHSCPPSSLSCAAGHLGRPSRQFMHRR